MMESSLPPLTLIMFILIGSNYPKYNNIRIFSTKSITSRGDFGGEDGLGIMTIKIDYYVKLNDGAYN